MGRYTAAAHEAYNTVESQGGLLECRVPANNIVREFLLEARRQRQQAAGEGVDNMAAQMKRAADSLVAHPYRVHDLASAQKVHGCGAAIAKIIVENLFAEYPPEAPSEEELEELRRQEAAIKQAAAAQRKRKKEAAAAAAAGEAPGGRAALPAPAPVAGAAAAGGGGGEGDEEGQQRGGKRAKKGPKEYIPRLRSAPYAFLICMLQAQKGPAKQQHFGKQEVMELAEASGLADKPIFGDGTAARSRPDGRSFQFDGWNGFRTQLIAKGLAHEWSNPKKVSLTPQGFALAERLYRDGVARGVLQPISGIPTAGPMLFQLEEAEPGAAAAAAAAAGVPAGVLPSAALQAGRRLPAAQQQQQQRAAPRQQAGAVATPPLRRQGSAAGAGAGAGAGGGLDLDLEPDYFGLPLAERLLRQQQQQQQQPAQAQQWAQPRPQLDWPEAGAGNARATAAAPAIGRAAAGAPPAAAAAALGSPGADVIDLLSDGDSPLPLPKHGAAAAAAAPPPALAAVAGAGAASAAAVPDAQVAAMVSMGYSDKKARRALRRSLGETGLPDIGRAVELAELLDSDGGDSSDDEEQLPHGLLRDRLLLNPATARAPAVQAVVPGQAGLAPARPASRQQRQQQPAALPPPAAGAADPGWPVLGANPAIFAGGVPPAAAGGRPAAAPPRHEAPGRPQQGAPAGPRRVAAAGAPFAAGGGGGGGGAVGHIRMGGSQRDALDDSQQQGGPGSEEGQEPAAPGAAFDIDRFFAQLDRLLQQGGEGGSGAAGGCGGGGASSSSQSSSLELQRPDVRLPPLPPGRRFVDEYEVLLLVDGREQYRRTNGQGRCTALEAHLSQMRNAGLVVEQRQLPIGDAVWIARSRLNPRSQYVLDYVLERKSVSDLLSSIKEKTNRYERQKYFLKRCGLRHVYYLIEGDPDTLPAEVDQKSVRTAGANTQVLDGLTVLRTTDHNSTFRLYQRLTGQIQNWYGDMRVQQAQRAAAMLPTFAAWQAHCKENNEGTTTLHDVWGMMLASVPTLGPDAVQAILLHYPTPLHLYRAFQQVYFGAVLRGEDGHRAAERLLYGLKSSGGSRTIGPEKAAKVYNCLFKKRAGGVPCLFQ